MEELKQTTLSKPFKPQNNDAATLAALIGDLNSKNNVPLKQPKPTQQIRQTVTEPSAIPTQLQIPPTMTTEEIAANEIIMQAELAKAASVENIPVEAQRAANRATAVVPTASIPATPDAPAPIVAPARLFVTGHPGAIDTVLDDIPGTTKLVSLSRTVEDVLKATCLLAGNPPAATLLEFRKFGDGEFAPTLANIFILGIIRRSYPTFGTPGFWANLVLETGTGESGNQLVIVGVRTSVEFKALQSAGFSHYHIMASAHKVQQRTPKDYNQALSGLAQALDNDTHKKLIQRAGPRLNVVWNDSANPPSPRLISAPEFKQSVLGAEPSVVGSDSVSQIL